MKNSKVLSALIAFCTIFALSFPSLAKKKIDVKDALKKEGRIEYDLKDILKRDYNLNYTNSVESQQNAQEKILKNLNTKEDKELARRWFYFTLCLAQLFKYEKFWLNKSGEFENFVLKNFVEKKFDFVNYDKNVFTKMKNYLEKAYKKSDLMFTKFYKPEEVKNKESEKELEKYINQGIENLFLQLKNVKDKNVLEKIKKDLKNKKSELYKKFIADLKKELTYNRDNFRKSLKSLEKFKNEKAFRIKVNNKVKDLNLKDLFNELKSF